MKQKTTSYWPELLDAELCQKFFSIFILGTEGKAVSVPAAISTQLQEFLYAHRQELLDDNMQRNASFFDEEYEKLDKWADDMKISLEREIKDLDAEIKLKKAEVRKILDLKKKVAEQRNIREMERKRNEKRQRLFEAQDSIDSQKESLISEIEARLQQQTFEETLFTIRWHLV